MQEYFLECHELGLAHILAEERQISFIYFFDISSKVIADSSKISSPSQLDSVAPVAPTVYLYSLVTY